MQRSPAASHTFASFFSEAVKIRHYNKRSRNLRCITTGIVQCRVCKNATLLSYSKLFDQLLVYLLNKRAIGQKVAQFNAKFRLTLNWTLLHLLDFTIMAQIIVGLIMDLTNTRVVDMLVIKNTA